MATPDWFIPDPVEAYEVWDLPGHSGSVWIRKQDGHLFFYDLRL